jgi:3-deoxy-manno-octulosonate cytidylyltransferase (CMP-KDO synthetase)
MKKGYIGVIPARYGSTRFEGKPLVSILGKSMIQRVYEQAQQSQILEKIIVATDDHRIFDHVKKFGGEVCMTRASHPSGTDRIAEVVAQLQNQSKPYDPKVIVNIQGDEPLIDPNDIDCLAELFFKNRALEIATLVSPCKTIKELENENIVKAILNKKAEAIYFSRLAIPYYKSAKNKIGLKQMSYFKHKGIYAYTASALLKISQLAPCDLEKAESLEQLRWIFNGYKIQTASSANESIGVDMPEDIKKILKILKKSIDK